jgi:hypothetical protein
MGDKSTFKANTSEYLYRNFNCIYWIIFLKGQTKLIVASTVFSLQIMYKTLTLFTVVNAITNPVVLSNLAINVVHISTLVIVLKHYPNLLK